VNLYRGFSPARPRWGRVYGGQTVAQALVAAAKTVKEPFVAHSLHAYFVLAGDDSAPIVYTVDRIRDGSSFCTRDVVASQKGRAIFQMGVSFHVPEKGLEYQQSAPLVPSAESLPSMTDAKRNFAERAKLPETVRAQLLADAALPFPMEMRRIDPVDPFAPAERVEKRDPPVQRCWMRVTGRLKNDPVLHQCALAYLSDWSLLSTSLLPHGIRSFNNPNLRMASLDHSMWFHRPFRADEWLLYDCICPSTGNARGLNFGRFFTTDGALVVSVAQEGLMRLIKRTSLSKQIDAPIIDKENELERKSKSARSKL